MSQNYLLPSGKTLTVKDGKGEVLLHAQRKAKTPEEIMFAMMAELIEIDDQSYVYEDLFQMPLEDILAIQAVLSGKQRPAQLIASSTSPKQQDGNTAN